MSGAGQNSKGHSSVPASLREAAIDRSMGAHAMDASTVRFHAGGSVENLEMVKCWKCKREIRDPQIWRNDVRLTKKGWCHNACPKRPLKPKQGRIAKRTHSFFAPSVDTAATCARKFLNSRSRVMRDGREILEGEDYKARVREVEERDEHKCQRELGLLVEYRLRGDKVICGKPAGGHPHHIIKRSKGRDDRAANLSSRCDECNLSQSDHPEHKTQFAAARRAPGEK